MQKASGHGHFLEMKNTAYHSPYDLVDNIYIVYKIRDYDGTGTEHNYLYIDISNFPTSYYNPCWKDMWNVICLVYDTTSGKFSLCVNHGKICDFACRLPLRASTVNLFNHVICLKRASWCYCTHIMDLYLEYVILKSLFVFSVRSYTMQGSRQVESTKYDAGKAKGIVRSYIMSKKRRNKPVATGIISDCDVCGGFMFNAKRYIYNAICI